MSNDLLTRLLRDVSRSFYLTLRILPSRVRPQIGLAYLLARATDTIADTEIVPVAERLDTLEQLRRRILGTTTTPCPFSRFAESGFENGVKRATSPSAAATCRREARRAGNPPQQAGGLLHSELSSQTDSQSGGPADAPRASERLLLNRIEEALTILGAMSQPDRELIREVLGVITDGQALDLQRFGGASQDRMAALETDQELVDYTYRVAGCVGEFWTKICRAHLFPRADLDDKFLLHNGVLFGQGLQLVNILRDLPRDLRLGRCYLPREKLGPAGLNPGDLLHPENEPRLRPIYDAYLDRAESHLRAGWAYTCALPFRSPRVRLACAWPILIGARTVTQLRRANILDSAHRVKISRKEVRGVIFRSLAAYPFPRVWRQLWTRFSAKR